LSARQAARIISLLEYNEDLESNVGHRDEKQRSPSIVKEKNGLRLVIGETVELFALLSQTQLQ
jgi:hypothetical protein